MFGRGKVIVMKKFLALALLAFAVIIGQAAQVEAREVYCFSETRGGKTTDNYVETNSVQDTNYGIKVQMHTVGSGINEYWEVGFTQRGNDLYIVWLPSTSTTLIASGNRIIEPDYFKILQALP